MRKKQQVVLRNTEFNESIQKFKIRLEQQGRSQGSVDSMTGHITEFLGYQSEKGIEKVNDIQQEQIDDFIDYLHNERKNKRKNIPISTTYILKFREAILRYMEFVTNRKLGESIYEIQYIKPDGFEKEILSEQEILQLMDACDNSLEGMTDKCILSLLYGCGLRRKELMTLEIHEIDFNKSEIRLDKTKTKNERDVVMSPQVQQILEQYVYSARNLMLGNKSNESFLIVTSKGYKMSIGTLPFRLNRLAKRANLGKKINAHQLRHSIATHLLENLTLEEVGVFLGHRCLDSTQIYTHIKNNTL